MPFLRERSGRWSPVKIVAFVAAVLPALWIAYQAAADELGARPVTEAIHQAGDWALRFLLITLAIAQAQHILNYPRIILARRTLGVACAGYAVLHFSLYVLDQHFDLFKVASEIVLRIYLTIGALGLAGLIALASTSTDAAISRLGSGRWPRLHPLVYGIAVLAAAHLFIQSPLALLHPSKPEVLPAVAGGGVPDLAAGVPPPFPPQRRGHPASPRASRRRRGRGNRDRRGDDLFLHQRRRRAAHPACAFRHRDGGATGVVGSRRRPRGRRHRFLAAKARASARERAADFAQRRVGRGPGPVRQLMAKPSALPLAVTAGIALCFIHRRGQID